MNQYLRYASLTSIFLGLSGIPSPVDANIIGIDAEGGTLGQSIAPPRQDFSAIGAEFISTQESTLGNLPTNVDQLVSYSIDLPVGNYHLYVRCRVGTQSGEDDSFFAANGFGIKSVQATEDWFLVDDLFPSSGTAVNDINGNAITQGNWSWINLSTETPVSTYTTLGGMETFMIGGREDGFSIDAFAFVDVSLSPTETELTSSLNAGSSNIRNVAFLDPFTTNRFPQTVAFRTTERALSNRISFWNNDLEIEGSTSITLEDFTRDMQRWDIIVGKGLREERTANMERVIEGFNLVKAGHPEKLVLLHFNGRNRRQDFLTHEDIPFFPGHWLYRVPSVCRTDIPAVTSETTITIDDLPRYIGNNGLLLRNLEFTLYAVNGGVRDFTQAEYVGSVSDSSFDLAAGTITVRRGLHGTTPLAFTAGECEVAQQTIIGTRYQYNWGASCPLDPQGRTCYDILAEEIAARFGAGGSLSQFDGILFDAMSFTTVNDRFDDFDINMDGVIDPRGFLSTTGLFDHWIGYAEFSQKLRKLMGDDFIIMGDSRTPSHHRSFAFFNGTESEEWPHPDTNTTFFKHWSSGIARHQFLETRLREPRLHYFNPRAENREEERLTQVAAACVDAPVITEYRWRLNTQEVLGYTDEMSRGFGFEFDGWLGEPLGPMVRMAEDPANLLASETRANIPFSPSAGISTFENAGLGGLPISTITIPNIPNPGEELYLKIRLRADDFLAYDNGIPRVCYVRVDRTGTEKFPLDSALLADLVAAPNAYEQNCHVDEDGVEYGFYFRWLNTDTVTLTLTIEGLEPAMLERLEVYNAADVVHREFQNGVVIENPSPNAVSVDLDTLFPGRSFRRIDGYLDSEVNTGSTESGQLIIPAFDGLMLTTQTQEDRLRELRQFAFGSDGSHSSVTVTDPDTMTFSFQRRLPNTLSGTLAYSAQISDDLFSWGPIDLSTDATVTPVGDNLYEWIDITLPQSGSGLDERQQFIRAGATR